MNLGKKINKEINNKINKEFFLINKKLSYWENNIPLNNLPQEEVKELIFIDLLNKVK